MPHVLCRHWHIPLCRSTTRSNMNLFDAARRVASDVIQVTTDKAIELGTRMEPHVNSAITATQAQFNEAATYWKDYRTRNPTADSAILKIGETLDDIQKKLGDVSDNVSGAKVLEQANALIEQQRKYNDVLATRLAEALDEIKDLNARVGRLEKTDDCR